MDQDLIKDQFMALYNQESDSVFRYCLLRTSSREVALDLTQDTFMRFWETLSRRHTINQPRAFLFTIARNSVIDWYRKKKAVSLERILEADPQTMILAQDSQGHFEARAEARHLIERIKDLEPLYQQVVYLRLVEELNPSEIATIMKLSVNVVSVRINRGIHKLRQLSGYEEKE